MTLHPGSKRYSDGWSRGAGAQATTSRLAAPGHPRIMLASTHSRITARHWLLAFLAIGAIAALAPSPAAAGDKAGAVYTQTNEPENRVVVFRRAANGTITEIARVGTGGVGSPSNPPFGSPVLDSQGAVELTDDGRLLFAVNAGSDTVSSFRVTRGGLKLVDQEGSGGDLPISVDSHNGLLYVLNELSGNIAGLTYDSKGEMTPLAGSREPLSTPGPDGVSAQIAFNPRGTVLTVTERFQDRIDTFVLGADGTPGPAIANASNAPTPFGFAYDRRGRLIVSNAGPRFTFEGSGSSYRLTGSGTLASIDNEAADGIATCWVVVTGNGKYSFMTNTGSSTVSRFQLANNGGLTLLGTTPTTPGLAPNDAALSRNSRYLYVLSSTLTPDGTANIDAYRVGSDGSLTPIGVTPSTLPAGASGLAAR